MLRIRRLGPVISAAAVGAALTLSGVGIATATSTPQPASASSPVHAAKAKPCTTLFAVVDMDGHLKRKGCKGMSSKYLGNGYQVLFPRNVRSCAYVATAGTYGFKNLPTTAVIAVAGRMGHPNGVFLTVEDLSGNRLKAGFQLIVECPAAK